MTTATSTDTVGPEQLKLAHAALWRTSTSFNGDRWLELWQGLDAETREQIKTKAHSEHITSSAAMRDWWPELYAPLAVVPLYRAYPHPYVVGQIDSDGLTLLRTERSWQRHHHAAQLDPSAYLVADGKGDYRPLVELLAAL